MRRLVLASAASAAPMGAQGYQEAIAARAATALGQVVPTARVERFIARSVRSSLPGTRRLPMRLLQSASPRTRRLVGRAVYPADALVHRMELGLPPGAGPDIVTLHDVVAWTYPDEAPPPAAAADELRRADAVICVSHFTAQEAQARLGLTNVTVVHNGVDPRFFDAGPLPAGWLSAHGVRGPYVLYAGGSASRKNLPGLADAWARIAGTVADWQLVLAGPPSEGRTRLFADSPRVVHLGRVEDELMPSLVASAGCVVVPSHCEGFGLPALEAMAAGVPLVSSNRSSLPEIVGEAGLLVDPTPEALGEALHGVLTSSVDMSPMVLEGRRRAAQFTWDRSAAGHAAVWSRFL